MGLRCSGHITQSLASISRMCQRGAEHGTPECQRLPVGGPARKAWLLLAGGHTDGGRGRMDILRNPPCPPEPARHLSLRGRPLRHKSLQAAGAGSSGSVTWLFFFLKVHVHENILYCGKYSMPTANIRTLKYSKCPKCEKPHVTLIPAAYSPPLLERLGSYRERQQAQVRPL